MLDKILLMHL